MQTAMMGRSKVAFGGLLPSLLGGDRLTGLLEHNYYIRKYKTNHQYPEVHE